MWRAVGWGIVLIALSACTAPRAAPGATPPAAPAASSATAASAAAPVAPAAVAPLSPPATVKVATLQTMGEAPFFLALDRGYFAEEGIELEFTRVAGAAETMPHLATGQLDVGSITPSSSLFNAVLRGVPLRIAASGARSAPPQSASNWVLREDVAAAGNVREIADLRGLTLGINVPNTGTLTDVVLDKTLERGGLTRADVEIAALGYPDMNTALAGRVVDAALASEPFTSLGESQGILRRWLRTADITPNQYSSAMLYSPTFAESEAAKRFMVGYLRGARDYTDAFFYNRDKPAAVDILVRNTTVKDPKLYDQMGFNAIDPNGEILIDRLESDVEYYLSKGYMQQPVDPRQVIDRRFLDYALARLGPYRPPTP